MFVAGPPGTHMNMLSLAGLFEARFFPSYRIIRDGDGDGNGDGDGDGDLYPFQRLPRIDIRV